jgi:DNA-binding response OmpR family regulator
VRASGVVQLDAWLTIDRDRCEVWAGGRKAALSATELKLLFCFLDNPGRVLTHQTLLAQVWGWEYTEERQYLKVHINHLRKKIEPDPRHPCYILTERGLGYRFNIPGDH